MVRTHARILEREWKMELHEGSHTRIFVGCGPCCIGLGYIREGNAGGFVILYIRGWRYRMGSPQLKGKLGIVLREVV